MDIGKLHPSTQATLMLRDPRAKRDFTADDDTRPYLLSDPNDSTSVVTIDVLGPDNPKVARLMAPQRARYMQQALMTQSRKGVKLGASDIASEESENLEIAVAATVGWSGFTNGGEPFPFSADNARELYDVSKDVMEQVLTFVRDRSSFLSA